ASRQPPPISAARWSAGTTSSKLPTSSWNDAGETSVRRRYTLKQSTDRILTTHAGSLPRPADLLAAMESGGATAIDADAPRLRSAVGDIVRKQAELGVDVVDDGEYGKPSFVSYINERLAGCEGDNVAGPRNQWAKSREGLSFPEFYAQSHVASRHTHM